MSDVPSYPSVCRAAPARTGRDGEDARKRLFQAALQLFARKGFGNTSTRELAEAAGVNIAAISYYFGDKAGLYRAVFFEPMGVPEDDVSYFDDPSLSLREMLGHAQFDEHRYHYQTLKDNVSLFTPGLLDKVNQLAVESGHVLLKKKEDEALRGRCDSFVVGVSRTQAKACGAVLKMGVGLPKSACRS